MGRIISYDEKNGYNDGDYLLLDNGEGGTKRIRADRVGIQLDPTLTDPNKAAPANTVKPVDAVPTQGSTNAVSSGGVYSALDSNTERIESLEDDRYKPYPTDIVSGSIASFPDGADNIPMADVTVAIDPVQDLHGYDNPWPAGGGKNKLKNNLTSGEINGVTATVDADGVISFSGTTNAITVFIINAFIDTEFSKNTNYVLSGCTGGGFYTYRLEIYKRVGDNIFNYNGDTQFQLDDTDDGCVCRIVVQSGINMSGVKIYPMIRLATDTDATYAPYENICPISGHTQAVVTRTGVNVWDEEWELGSFNSQGNPTTSSSYMRSKNYIPLIPNATYYFVRQSIIAWVYYYTDTGYIKYVQLGSGEKIFTPPSNATRAKFLIATSIYGTTYNHDISINYPSTDHSYHPYTGRSITINLGQTVYGGTLDVVKGELVVDRAMIASYNGETLPSEWISDRDKYVAGATPTTGAQVIYKLSQAVTLTLSPTEVRSLLGENNVWADTGDSTVTYRADTKLYINRKIAEAVSALS